MDNLIVSDTDESPPCLILGAIMDLGQYHHYRQSAIDRQDEFGNDNKDDEDDDDMDADNHRTALPDNIKRRHQRRSLSERLGNHKPSSSDYGGAAKRAGTSGMVQTTTKSSSTTTTTTNRWHDLDLQHVWIEVVDGRNHSRHILAFESLELLLLDEDTTPQGWPDEEE